MGLRWESSPSSASEEEATASVYATAASLGASAGSPVGAPGRSATSKVEYTGRWSDTRSPGA